MTNKQSRSRGVPTGGKLTKLLDELEVEDGAGGCRPANKPTHTFARAPGACVCSVCNQGRQHSNHPEEDWV